MHGINAYLPEKAKLFTKMSQQLGASIFAFNYRGFGSSDGAAPDEAGIMLDTQAIVEYFEKQTGGFDEVILWGKSFGCATSIYMTMKNPKVFSHIILETGFTSARNVMKQRLRFGIGHLAAVISTVNWPSIDRIGKLKQPILFIVGNKD